MRRCSQNPAEILRPYVREGMTVLEPGSGMGYFTLELACLVGTSGRVIGVDIQTKMLEGLKRRAAKAGLEGRIQARVASTESMGIDDLRGSIDFTLAFAVVHEFPDAARFFAEVAATSKPGATLLFAEPTGHVKAPEFESEMKAGLQAGFGIVDHPSISHSHAVLMRKR